MNKYQLDQATAEDLFFFGLVKRLPVQEGFHLLPATAQGMIVDRDWKQPMAERHEAIIMPQGDEVDAVHPESNRPADVKWCGGLRHTSYGPSAAVYLSHNEYLAGRERDTIFVVFADANGAVELAAVFPFSAAKLAGAITPYEGGRPAACARLGGKIMPPWSIDLFNLDPSFRYENHPMWLS